MPLLSTTNLSKSFDPVDIFNDVNLSIPHKARIGLVGPNGVGKTTLLRILVGLDEPSSGSVQRSKNLRVGYLPQESHFEGSGTLWEECLTVFSGLMDRQRQLADLEAAMASPSHSQELMDQYGRLQHEFDLQGGYTFEVRIRQVLTGLGFSRADEHRPVVHLSGGQRTRALLARLLLSNPDLLLLDEPTNHLDIEAVEWLEAYLKEWDGAAFIVSHDRYFLDQVVDHIYEMTPELEVYRGNYSAYLIQRADRYEHRLAEYEKQQEFIEKEEEFIRRNLAGQNTRQAQGRRTRLARMLEETRLAPPRQPRRLRLNLTPAARSGDLVVRTYGLQVGYKDEGKPLFTSPDLVLRRGECAAVIGPNGAGKTTFLKTLLDQIPPFAGEVALGASLKIGYFAQAHEGLHPRWSLMDEIQALAPKMLPGEIRDYLAKFLFTGEDVFKTVDVLSGGERGRLALACLAMQGANLLLLDEPTNHLDLPAQEVLQSILGDFNGTILLVSHDRYLIDSLATQIWEVQTAGRTLRIFEGSYSEFKTVRQGEQLVQAVQTVEKPTQVVVAAPAGISKDRLRRRQQQVDALEKEIASLELEITAINNRLSSVGIDPAEAQRLGHEYARLEAALNQKVEEWGELAEG
ncbi:MAG TPA: ABC-F family ATP-binding cassette domain-containing protein [Longilinea sp.]|nr:ABC-F family ATP-binding cassette domain-containing protein [Longilinea sp.]